MKYCVEFGVRGGAHCETLVLPTEKLANQFARNLVNVFTNSTGGLGGLDRHWFMPKHCYRVTWKTETHYVAISRLDGISRGPASSKLWPVSLEPISKPIMNSEWYA